VLFVEHILYQINPNSTFSFSVYSWFHRLAATDEGELGLKNLTRKPMDVKKNLTKKINMVVWIQLNESSLIFQ